MIDNLVVGNNKISVDRTINSLKHLGGRNVGLNVKGAPWKIAGMRFKRVLIAEGTVLTKDLLDVLVHLHSELIKYEDKYLVRDKYNDKVVAEFHVKQLAEEFISSSNCYYLG